MVSDIDTFPCMCIELFTKDEKDRTRNQGQTGENPKVLRYPFYTIHDFAHETMNLVTEVKTKMNTTGCNHQLIS